MIIPNTDERYAVLNDITLRLNAERLVLKCGVRSDLKGYRSLIDAVILYGTGTCDGFCDIYRVIGEIHHVKPKSALRDITYALSQAFDLAASLSAIVGATIPPSDIHSGLIIAYLGRLLMHPSLSDEKSDSERRRKSDATCDDGSGDEDESRSS